VLGALSGLLAGFAALAVAELVAAGLRPQAGPVVAVGGAAIDRTPTAVKDWAEQLRRAAEQQRAEREARRPMCAGCGTRFADERWKTIEPAEWDAPRETHPHLCEDCKQRVITAERQVEYTKHGPQHDEQVVPEQKAGGTWLSRFRP
jgi:hypothetical protein